MFARVIVTFFVFYYSIQCFRCDQDVNKAKCVVQYLLEKNLLKSTLFPPYKKTTAKNFESSVCGKIIDRELERVKKIYVNEILSKYQNFTEEGTKQSKLEECVVQEYVFQKLGEKLLKSNFYENDQHPKSSEVQEIINKYTINIEKFCSGSLEKDSLRLLNALSTNDSEPMHPARMMFLNHEDSDSCFLELVNDTLNRDDNVTVNDSFKFLSEIVLKANETENCTNLLKNLKDSIEDEWHILRKFDEDDVMQRCFIGILKKSNDAGIKIAAMVMNTAWEFEDESNVLVRKLLFEHDRTMHNLSYGCIADKFDKY